MLRTAALAALVSLTACATQTPASQPASTPATTAPATAEMAPLIPRAPIFGNPERSQGRISPDGKMVSWLAPKDGVMNVWVAPVDDPAQAKAITNDTYRGIRIHQWAPNSTTVLFMQDKGGNENFHVYSANTQTGEVRDLTPIKEGARAGIAAISPDVPSKILVATNERNAQIFDLFLVDLATGKRKLAKKNPGYAGWVIDNTLTPRFGRRPLPGGGMEIVDFNGKVLLTVPSEDFMTSQIVGFDNSNKFIYAIDSRGRDKAAAVKISAKDGSVTVLATSDKADISTLLLHPTTREPLAYSVNYLKSELTAMTPETEADLKILKAKLSGDIELVALTDDTSKVVVYSEAADAPGIYSIYDRATKTVTTMFETRPALKGTPLQPMHPREIKSRDGLTLVSYLTLPPGSDPDGDGVPNKPQPTVLWVHGGPWSRDAYGYNGIHQWMANRGYAVLSVNYRGSTGFGKSFTNAAVGEFAGKMHDDLIDAVKWAVDAGVADKDKIAITGGSYGGYATLIGVTFTPEQFACGVDIVGPSSLVTLIESFPEYWKPFLGATWYKFVGDPADPKAREDMLNRSAIRKIDAIKVPLLVGQGQNDPRVTKLESDQLVKVMSDKGLPVTYVNFPDEGHGFARPQNRIAFFAVMEGFLESCLGGRSEPLGETVKKSTMQVLQGADHVPGLKTAAPAPKTPPAG